MKKNLKISILAVCIATTALAGQEPQRTAPPAAPTPAEVSAYKGLHLAFWGGYGLSNPNATFSTFLSGTGPDYRSATEFAMTMAYYWSDSNGITLGAGAATRNLAFKDSSGKANYPMNFVDLRLGYRNQRNILLLELGIQGSIKLKDVPVTVETASGSVSGSLIGIDQKNYVAIYALIGAYYPFTNSVFGLITAKVDYGVTAAVDGNWPLFNSAGKQVGSEKFSLIPFNLGFTLGIAFRL